MTRLIISKQLEQAEGENYTVLTDSNGDQYYVLAATVIAASETDLVVTTDGTTTGVTQSGTSNHTVNIKLRSTDANQALVIGSDGGLFISSDALGAFSNFDITDGTTTQTVDDGEEISFEAGDGVEHVVSATNTVTTNLRVVVEEFNVTSSDGDTVTIVGTLPASEDMISITRNGVALADADWSLAGSVITFADAFGGSTGGTDAEQIIVRYFEG